MKFDIFEAVIKLSMFSDFEFFVKRYSKYRYFVFWDKPIVYAWSELIWWKARRNLKLINLIKKIVDSFRIVWGPIFTFVINWLRLFRDFSNQNVDDIFSNFDFLIIFFSEGLEILTFLELIVAIDHLGELWPEDINFGLCVCYHLCVSL